MNVIVNGKPTETPARVVADFVEEYAGASAHVAVVVNGCVMPAAECAAAPLNDGDRIDLLTFAGGG